MAHKKHKSKHHPNHPHAEPRELKNEKDIAINFASQVHKRFDLMIKSSILFGSQAKNEATPGSDIDVIFIIDDASINWDLELISWYREELAKIIASNKYARELHINTMKLTTFWNDLLHGDPVVLNILRYGEALIDSGGFFNPVKALLLQGKIRSTPEAVYSALQRAPNHLARSKVSVLNAIEGVYWCMTDSAQAALITAGKLPPSPEHIPEMLKEMFVDTGLIKIELVRALRDIYMIHKGIAHGSITHVKGAEIDRWQYVAENFMSDMTKVIDSLIDHENKK